MPSDRSPQTGPPPPSADQLRWLQSPAGQWSRVEQAWLEHLDQGKLEAEAPVFGLDPSELELPGGDPAKNLDLFKRSNPGLDPLREKDSYELALGVLRMLSPENPL